MAPASKERRLVKFTMDRMLKRFWRWIPRGSPHQEKGFSSGLVTGASDSNASPTKKRGINTAQKLGVLARPSLLIPLEAVRPAVLIISINYRQNMLLILFVLFISSTRILLGIPANKESND